MDELTYKEVRDEDGGLVSYLRSDGWSIPLDPQNGMFQVLQAKIAAGYVPDPAA